MARNVDVIKNDVSWRYPQICYNFAPPENYVTSW